MLTTWPACSRSVGALCSENCALRAIARPFLRPRAESGTCVGRTGTNRTGVRTDPVARKADTLLRAFLVPAQGHGDAAVRSALHGVADQPRHLPKGRFQNEARAGVARFEL